MEENKKIFPWGLHPMEDWIKEELNKRANEYGQNPTANIQNEIYSGPKTAWARIFSNGKSKLATDKEGFVMGGTEGFEESYGFGKDGKVTIGVDAIGKPHELDASYDAAQRGLADFPHRPPPSIVSIDSDFAGASNSSFSALCRKTKIIWKCHSLAQLEYLTPYFLTPRITLVAEWGWNHYDTTSLVDLSDTEWLYGIFQGKPEYTTDWIKQSRGNYDLVMGFTSDYSYTLNEFGGYDCSTTILNPNYLIEGKSYANKKDYKADKNNPSGSLQLKDFTEFVFDDMDNLLVKSNKKKIVQKTGSGGYSPTQGGNNFAALKNVNPTGEVVDTTKEMNSIRATGKVFKNKDDVWLRMDLIANIINNFFQLNILGPDNNDTKIEISKFDINGVPVCAHPALKSTSKDFIIPNKFAPRFTSKQKSEKNNKKKLTDAQTPRGNYYTLFPNIQKLMVENELDEKYDDIVEALGTKNAYARSFPMYSDYTDDPDAYDPPKAGYWGYLSDIYVNVSFFKSLVAKNDTVLKLVEELLVRISESMCNIAQLKVVPDTIGGSVYTVIDVNFTPIYTKNGAEKLTRISLGSINSAFMKSAAFDMKMSGDMANQMIAQSASGKPLPNNYGSSNFDPKSMKVSVFSNGDRMFERAARPPTSIENSNNSPENSKVKFARMFTEQNKNFYVYTTEKSTTIATTGAETYATSTNFAGLANVNPTKTVVEKQTYILAENSSDFLKAILLDISDKKALYNSGIMPGTELKIEFLGISGMTFLSQFTLDHVPNSYNYEQCVWQISGVTQRIENKVWTTTVTAQARPLTSL